VGLVFRPWQVGLPMGQNLKHFKMRMLLLLLRGDVGVMVLE
jgi:hypothetical protein